MPTAPAIKPSTPPRHFAALVTAWLKANGATQQDLAVKIGVSATVVGNWLHGAALPPASRWPRVAEAMGLPLSTLAAAIAKDLKIRGGRRDGWRLRSARVLARSR